MAKKEAKTDLWVARQLDDCKVNYDAQGSDVKELNEALKSASKRGTGNAGYPEYVAVVKDYVIVIEDKADGSTKQKELATKTIKSYLVPLPPLSEQYRIVAKYHSVASIMSR